VRRTTLGGSGIEIGQLGLGCMGMSDFYGEPDDAESIRTIHRALELGVNHLDTADVYAMGGNEELIGRALADRRDKAVIATKFGLVRSDAGEWKGVRGDAAYVRECCERSLERLGVETIDLYYQHRVDPDVPIEDTVGAMKELVEAGKVRSIGLSEAGPETIRRAHAVHPIAALQSEYSLWSRSPERDVLALCRELGITFVAYSPLGRGMLTATVRRMDQLPEGDYRRGTPRFEGGNFERNLALVENLSSYSEEKGLTPAQVALSWVLSQSDWSPGIVSIPGTKRVRYLEQNVEAADIPLTRSELIDLGALFPPGAASGERYPEHRLSELGR
jgi:aryl-alcohol dehydrogenase-like predicted oxidoreductase